MNGAAGQIAALLGQVPPAGLAVSGAMAAAGVASICSAAVDTVRVTLGTVVRVREQQWYDRQFRAIVRADRRLDRDARRLARNHQWAAGGPGMAELAADWFFRGMFAPVRWVANVLDAGDSTAGRHNEWRGRP